MCATEAIVSTFKLKGLLAQTDELKPVCRELAPRDYTALWPHLLSVTLRSMSMEVPKATPRLGRR